MQGGITLGEENFIIAPYSRWLTDADADGCENIFGVNGKVGKLITTTHNACGKYGSVANHKSYSELRGHFYLANRGLEILKMELVDF